MPVAWVCESYDVRGYFIVSFYGARDAFANAIPPWNGSGKNLKLFLNNKRELKSLTEVLRSPILTREIS